MKYRSWHSDGGLQVEVAPCEIHEGDFFGCFGGCGGVADDDEDARALIPSVKGE